MKRVFITGAAGSGKTRLSRILHEIIGIKPIHLDHIFVDTRNGKPHPKAYVDSCLKNIIKDEEWIIEGAQKQAGDIVMSRFDHLVVLDFDKSIRCQRILKRTYEKFGLFKMFLPYSKPVRAQYRLFKNSLTNRAMAQIYTKILLNEAPDHVMCFQLKSDADVEKFIKYARAQREPNTNL